MAAPLIKKWLLIGFAARDVAWVGFGLVSVK
jgi:hypothetical protein